MHLAQAKILFFEDKPLGAPEGAPFSFLFVTGTRTHCKLSFTLLLVVGLYFPRNFTNRQTKLDFFPQIWQTLDIVLL